MSQTNQEWNLSKQGEFLVYERQFSPPYIYSGLYKEQDPQFCKEFDLESLLTQIKRNRQQNITHRYNLSANALEKVLVRKQARSLAKNFP